MDGDGLRGLLPLRLEELLGGVPDAGPEAAGGRQYQGTLMQAVIARYCQDDFNF